MHVFLDFEASSLAKQSYPIEVAWVFEDGRSESYLIRPLPTWTDWDERAAAIHGIPRGLLERDGSPVDAIAHRMLATLAEHRLFASSPSWDGKWLSVLLRGGGLPRHALRLRDTDEALLEAATGALAGSVPSPDLERAAQAVVDNVRAAAEGPVAHRALPDAEHERRLWLAVGREANRHAEATRPKTRKSP